MKPFALFWFLNHVPLLCYSVLLNTWTHMFRAPWTLYVPWYFGWLFSFCPGSFTKNTLESSFFIIWCQYSLLLQKTSIPFSSLLWKIWVPHLSQNLEGSISPSTASLLALNSQEALISWLSPLSFLSESQDPILALSKHQETLGKSLGPAKYSLEGEWPGWEPQPWDNNPLQMNLPLLISLPLC